MLPLLTGIADYSGKKKGFLKAFAYLGSVACAGMFFFEGGNIEYGMLTVILASIGYSGSLVFYDAYLPEIATPDQYDRLSARGYSFGYIGSVILLVFNLLMIQMPGVFGLPEDSPFTCADILCNGSCLVGCLFTNSPSKGCLPMFMTVR